MSKRAILTFLVCMAIILGWTEFVLPIFYPKKPRPPKNSNTNTEQKATKPIEAPPSIRIDCPVPEKDFKLKPEGFSVNIWRYELFFYNGETEELRKDGTTIKFDSLDASITNLDIHYNNDKINLIKHYPNRASPLKLNIREKINNDIKTLTRDGVLWKKTNKSPENNPNFLECEHDTGHGIILKKQIKLTGKYQAEVKIVIENKSGGKKTLETEFTPFVGIEHDGAYRWEQYLTVFVSVNDSLKWLTWSHFSGDRESDNVSEKVIKYFGLKNRYFALAAIPREENDRRDISDVKVSRVRQGKEHYNNNLIPTVNIPVILEPGNHRTITFDLFFGPQTSEELSKLNISPIFSYGGFHFIGAALLWILNILHPIFGYGVAIIIATIIVKTLMFPLTKKQLFSMYKMQKLQPKVLSLQAKFKDDPKRLMQEQMKMYKENKVSPMGGCLPLLFQFPVWIAVYSVLDISVDLRKSSFLWIADLTEPDRLWVLPRPVILLLFPLYEINILPILMTVMWVVQSLLQPKPQDPQAASQQKMMMFMPIIFGLMFYGLAAGLSLYFLAQAGFGLLEQRIIKSMFAKEDADGVKEKSYAK